MEVNEKRDVFSFRMLTLEIIMGKHLGDHISSLSSPTFTTCDILLKEVLGQRLSLSMNQTATEVLNIAKIAIVCLHTIPQSRLTMQQVSQELSTGKPPFPNTLHIITLGELVKLLISEAQLSNNLSCLCSHCRPSTSSHTSPPNNMFDWQECIMFDWQKYIH